MFGYKDGSQGSIIKRTFIQVQCNHPPPLADQYLSILRINNFIHSLKKAFRNSQVYSLLRAFYSCCLFIANPSF